MISYFLVQREPEDEIATTTPDHSQEPDVQIDSATSSDPESEDTSADNAFDQSTSVLPAEGTCFVSADDNIGWLTITFKPHYVRQVKLLNRGDCCGKFLHYYVSFIDLCVNSF